MIGLSERGKPGTCKPLQADDMVGGKTLWGITVLNLGESGGTVPVKRE